jgi:hypothetical protein
MPCAGNGDAGATGRAKKKSIVMPMLFPTESLLTALFCQFFHFGVEDLLELHLVVIQLQLRVV